MGAGPWPTLCVIIFGNVLQATFVGLVTHSVSVPIMTLLELGAMVAGLVSYVGLIGSGGSDIFGAGATTVAALRVAAMVLFVGAVAAITLTSPLPLTSLPGLVLGVLQVVLAGTALFQATSAAKPGG